MALELPAVFGTLADNFVSGLVVLFILLMIGLVILVMYLAGILAVRKYKVALYMPRANGEVKETKASGRFLKNGKFEVFYGILEGVVQVEAPQEAFIASDNTIRAFSPSKDEIYWVSKFSVNLQELKAEPTASPALRITYSNGVKEINDRFSLPNTIKEYAVLGAILLLGLMIGLGNYFGHMKVAEAQEHVAAAYGDVAQKLANATVTITRTTATPSGTSSSRPGG